jgi:2-succinyl-5-enolpyruvyl-6-hydroxy-3-cyclohexene-1-carboxylate synthase
LYPEFLRYIGVIMNIEDAPNLNYAWSMLMVEELVRCGVDLFCIAPGSRSSPLTVAAANHPKAKTIVHYDERGLAFFGLGHTSIKKQPAVLICSSGTATANFFPAIIETSKKKLPLIVLTADRPPELQYTGALQTIDQSKIYGNYVRWHTTLPTPDHHIPPEVLLTTVDQAVFMSQNPMGGPVHINCMFREPLAPDKTDFNTGAYLKSVEHWLKNEEVFTRYTTGKMLSDISGDRRVVSILDNAQRGVIVVGKLRSEEEEKAVIRLAEKLNWPIFPDIASGLRTYLHPNIINYYDQILLSNKLVENYPVNTVLHLGGRITSKRWYQLVEKHQPQHYITVLGHSLRNDPLHCVTLRIKSTVRDFANSIYKFLEPNQHKETLDFLNFLQRATKEVHDQLDHFIRDIRRKPEGINEQGVINEIAVARIVSYQMPHDQGIFMSNSMPIRLMDMFSAPMGRQAAIGSNRGASGIDGIIATACGFAHAFKEKTTLLIGDLAFLHDLNSLTLVKYLEKPIIIVVINNDGGGIFSFLPIAQSPAAEPVFEPFFGTPHGLKFADAAKMFGLDYAAPGSVTDFAGVYHNALNAEKSIIIEANTERHENHKTHLLLQEKIRSAINNMIK